MLTSRIAESPTSSRSAKERAADRGHRCRDEQRAGHEDHHLHLLHVVRDPRDQRRCAELVHLPAREPGDAVEQVAAHVAPEAHRRARPVVHRADGEADLHERDDEHQRADAQDVGVVARQDAVVDDLRVERRQVQRAHRLQELQHAHCDEHRAVGAELCAEEANEQRRRFRGQRPRRSRSNVVSMRWSRSRSVLSLTQTVTATRSAVIAAATTRRTSRSLISPI